MVLYPHVVEDKVIHSYSPIQHICDIDPCRVLQLHGVTLQTKEVRSEKAINSLGFRDYLGFYVRV